MSSKDGNGAKVYVQGLTMTVSSADLEPTFKKIGPVKDIHVTTNPPGFAVVEYKDPKDAPFAVKQLNGTMIGTMKVAVEMYSDATMRQAQAALMESSASDIPRPINRTGNTKLKLIFNTQLDSLHNVDVEEMFSKIGPLKEVWVLYMPPPGHYLMEMANPSDATQARLEMDNQYVGGNRMRVTENKEDFPKMESRSLRIHIKDLPDQIRRADLERELTSIGRVREVRIKYGTNTQCVVEYFVRAETDMALEEFNKRSINGIKVRATIWRGVWEDPRSDRSRRDRYRRRSRSRERKRRSRSPSSRKPSRMLTVTRLDPDDSTRDIERFFEKHGRVREIWFPSSSRKFCHVVFSNSAEASKANRDLNYEKFNGHRILVKEFTDEIPELTPPPKKKKSQSPERGSKPDSPSPERTLTNVTEVERSAAPMKPVDRTPSPERRARKKKKKAAEEAQRRETSPLTASKLSLGGIAKVEEGNKVIVRGIAESTSERDLDDVFFVYGAVKSIRIFDLPFTYAVVEYYGPKGVDKAVKSMNGRQFQGKKISVKVYSGPPEDDVSDMEVDGASPEREKARPNSRVFISNLPTRVSSTELTCALKRHLERAGGIKEIRLTDAKRGEACVEYFAADDAEYCAQNLDKSQFYGDKIYIRAAPPEAASQKLTTVIIQGFGDQLEDKKLEAQFARYGILTKFQVNRDVATPTAIIEYLTPDDAEKAQKELDGAFVGGSYIKVVLSKPPTSAVRFVVKDLPSSVNTSEVLSYFKRFGRVVDLVVKKEKLVFATVEYLSPSDASDAVRSASSKELFGRKCHIEWCRARSDEKYVQDMIAVEPDAKKDTKIDREHEKESRSESKKSSTKTWSSAVASRLLDSMDERPSKRRSASPVRGAVSSTSGARRRSASSSSSSSNEEATRRKRRKESRDREERKAKKKADKKEAKRSKRDRKEYTPDSDDAHKSKKQSSLVSSSRADQEDDDDVEAMLKDIDYFERVTIDSSSTDNMVVRANKGEVLVECDGGHCMMYQPDGSEAKYFELWFNHHKKYPLLTEACKFMRMRITKFKRHLQMMKYTADTYG